MADGGTLALTQQLTHLTDLGAPMEFRTVEQMNPFSSQPQNSPSQPLFQVSIELKTALKHANFVFAFKDSVPPQDPGDNPNRMC